MTATPHVDAMCCVDDLRIQLYSKKMTGFRQQVLDSQHDFKRWCVVVKAVCPAGDLPLLMKADKIGNGLCRDCPE